MAPLSNSRHSQAEKDRRIRSRPRDAVWPPRGSSGGEGSIGGPDRSDDTNPGGFLRPGESGENPPVPMKTPEAQRLEEENFLSAREAICRHTDGLFAWLMGIQWILGVVLSLWLSPEPGKGEPGVVSPQIGAAVFLGGAMTLLPILLAWRYPGGAVTRHVFAAVQMLYCGLLIHLTGGRIETHFHIFASLAFLAFYRDGWVLFTASVVALGDHFLRGLLWPESLYGSVSVPLWRSFEHIAWILFEDAFLIVAIRLSLREMRRVASREAELEILNAEIKNKVRERTRQLADSKERLRQLADSSPDVFWFMDLDPQRVRYVSPSVTQLWGVTREELYRDSRIWEKCVHPDDRARVRRTFAKAIRSRASSLECDYRIVLADGSVRWVQFRGSIIRDDTGRAVRLGGLARDVTEERGREAELRSALERQTQLTEQALAGERAKREFLAAMSHEIRTPLGGMLGFAEATLDLKGLPEQAVEYLQMIKDGGRALMRIIDDILDFSRMGAGRLRIEKAPFSPSRLLEEVRALFSHQARTKGISLIVEVAHSLPDAVLGDSGRIRQILLNLVGNALKFTPSGFVEIEARAVRNGSGAGRLEFVVEDTGPGVPPDLLTVIFEPFTQADFSNSREYGGVGLGLAISRKLAELMDGDLHAENLESGARFVLSLPLEVAEPLEEGAEFSPEDGAPLPGGKILIVEDDRINRALLLNMLRHTGCDVGVATNGQEAIDLFTKMHPDCVIMDVQMPVVDGIEATLKLREIERAEGRPPCYIVALTADIMPENRRNCLDAGMDGYLNKPVRKAELIAVLGAAGKARAARCSSPPIRTEGVSDRPLRTSGRTDKTSACKFRP
jgi:two-component system sensor histidine kinase/response regulator